MKKFIFSICAAMLLVCSCDLDILPSNSITTDSSLSSVEDAQKFRRDLYITVRDYIVSGPPIYLPELMSDSFHASIVFGNRNGEYYKWEMRSTFGSVESLWSNSYYCVMLANFLEQGIPEMDQTRLSNSDKAQLDIILGECAFVKAYTMFVLTELFCNNYSSNASSDYGVMLSDEPFTTPSDQASYPGRSTLAETYNYISRNLSKAETLLGNVSGVEGSIYFTKDAVTALKARIALTKGDYSTAITASTSLINQGTYTLIDNKPDFDKLWTNDNGRECIVQLWADYQSLPRSNCYDYVGLQSNGTYSPNYMPEQWIIDEFTSDDIRFQTWFKKTPVVFGTLNSNLYIFIKFPGNPELMPGETISTYLNKVKPFRIAEQYLIAAEAYAASGDAVNANKYLNALRAKRLKSYSSRNYSGEELITQIKKERAKELFGEGFRLKDLKRWNKGFARSAAQDDQIINNAGSTFTEFLSKSADDPFFLWPIPQSEIDSNPQIRGQQNPGY
ncbi:MAG TPA: RagB/SusD family nutrient uptake outer membrane protein [Bacteroidales bacterium]|jgi:hypothetical protein|nr:RagB/SusD family nutrient uptake outer membrane protein [Bacteroidales bacterium]HKM11884.1 RagB/SusD family nutrient uptake outer membrane protein [Bacteroidales bacterium]HPB89425.1 RagB/SusD family nutrient uptake outer membrane protein [Bacteroidales bacterium]HPY22091.1 RagB/SusD family nutrient uptake outer membrane protein [Bacteroidales bacterium]HQA93798.1 RagB/SusD family nutrient uptake outer membrane protein [Bacteroidales bacterium]